jgi:hypothetical protein
MLLNTPVVTVTFPPDAFKYDNVCVGSKAGFIAVANYPFQYIAGFQNGHVHPRARMLDFTKTAFYVGSRLRRMIHASLAAAFKSPVTCCVHVRQHAQSQAADTLLHK